MRRLAILLGALVAVGCGGSKAATASTPSSAASGTGSGPSSSTASAGTNVVLLARYTIQPGERLSPRTVFSPPHIRVELMVVSKDGRAHRALLHIPHPRSITVPRNGSVEQLLPLLPVGTYRLDIDGKPRGALHIGGAPGP